MPRRAARIDENQTQIVNDLRKLGASVQSLSKEGMGVPDLLVGYRGSNYLLEVKNPARTKKRQQANDAWQKPWHDAWRGQVAIITTLDEALSVIGVAPSVDVPFRGQIT